MIWLYTGTPGSGKSLHCAKNIYNGLIKGTNVIANFDINFSVFPKRKRKKLGDFVFLDNSELDPDLFMIYALANHRRNTNGHIVEGQSVIILDECQILFNSRDWNAKDRMAWATFFTQHRKYGFDVILITQFDRLIDRQIRSLVEYQIIHRKVSNFKSLGFLLGLPFGGNVFVAVTQWYGMRERIDCSWFVLHKKYASLFDSYKIFTAPAELGDLEGDPAKQDTENLSTAKLKKRNVLSDKLCLGAFWIVIMSMRLNHQIKEFCCGCRGDVRPPENPEHITLEEMFKR